MPFTKPIGRHPLWRSALLLAGWLGLPLVALAQPTIEHWETDNGARVYYVHAPELPMVDLRVTLDAGSARDGEHHGLAALTGRMLERGAGERDEEAIAEELEAVGADLSVSIGRDTASVSLRSLNRDAVLDGAMEVFTDVLARPTFPESAFERERRRTLVGIERSRQDPGTVAGETFHQTVFGDHPYAHPTRGRIETVEALERDQLKAFHQRYYVAANAVVAIVGDVDRERAEALAERATSGLERGEAAEPLPEVPSLEAERLEHVDFPSGQTHLLAGQPGMARGDDDYWALFVGNHILGGSGFGSRIMDEVREQRGLAYSAYSYFQPRARPGPFVMGLQTRADQAEEAEAVLRETLERFIEEGPSEEELQRSRDNLVGGFPLRIDSNSRILGYIAMIGFHELPLDHLDRFIENIEAVEAEDIQDAFKRRVDPDRLVVVTVGRGD